MKPETIAIFSKWSGIGAMAVVLAGCASTGDQPTTAGGTAAGPAINQPTHVKLADGRTVSIGEPSRAAGGGINYKNPHLDKCWVADGFNFSGYDVLYIAPTLSTAKYPDKPEDAMVHDLAKERLVSELVMKVNERKIFPNVVLKESDIKPGGKVLKLENTITEFTKGGGAARYWVGLYGGGQPVLRVQGKMIAGDKTVFTFEARRSGTSGGARVGGVFMKDEDIQIEDIRSLVLDLTDFMAAIAKKYQPKS